MAHGREEVQWIPDAIVTVTSMFLGGGRVVSSKSVTNLLYLLQAVCASGHNTGQIPGMAQVLKDCPMLANPEDE